MGVITHFNISECIEKYNLKYFVETGTGRGDSLRSALHNNFKHLYSVEIHTPTFEILKQNEEFNTSNITLINNNSIDALKEILPGIPKDEGIFFWLDAHYPGCYYGALNLHTDDSPNIRLPLKEEIEYILSERSGNDLIALDDLRLYETENFGSHFYLYDINDKDKKDLKINFSEIAIKYNYTFERSTSDQGYGLFRPKEK